MTWGTVISTLEEPSHIYHFMIDIIIVQDPPALNPEDETLKTLK